MIKQKLINFTREPISLIVLLIFLFAGDVLVKLCVYAHLEFHNYSAITRGLFFLVSILMAFINPTPFRKKTLLFLGILTLLFFIGQYTFVPYGFEDHLFKNFIFLSRYLFVFSILLFYNGTYNIPINKSVLNVFEAIIIVNTVAIFIGFLFDIDMLSSYQGNRFGFDGFFMVPSIATFFYAISLSYLAFNFTKNNTYKLFFTLVLIACLLVGTKALLLFVVATLIHLLVSQRVYLNKKFYLLVVCSGALLILIREPVEAFFRKTFAVLLNVYHESGFITMVTSYRNINLQTDLFDMAKTHWGFINYLIGGTNFTIYRVEFDFIDVLLFYGIAGGGLYLVYYFSHVIRFTELSGFGKIQMGFLLGIGFLSGTFFNNAPVAIYILIIVAFFSVNNKKPFSQENTGI